MIGARAGLGLSRRGPLLGSIPLPSLPLPAGARVMQAGHSMVNDNGFTGSQDGINLPLIQMASRTTGELPWLRGLDTRFNFDCWPDLNVPYKDGTLFTRINGAAQGQAGGTAAQLIPALPYYIARRPDIIDLKFWVNDIASEDASQAIADCDYVIRTITAAGIWLVIDTIDPVDVSYVPDGSPRLAGFAAFNAWLLSQAGRPGLKVNDTSLTFGSVRPSQTYWLRDGLHKQERGGYQAALTKVDLLRSMVTAGDYRNHDPRVSNLMPFATYANTGVPGTNGTRVTGTVASGMTALMTTGASTVVASLEASDVAGYWKQVFTITPIADANVIHTMSFQHLANVTLASLGIADNDWLWGEQTIDVNGTGFVRYHWNIFLSVGTSTKWTQTIARSASATAGNHFLQPPLLNGFRMESDSFQVPPGQSINNLRVATSQAAGGISWRGDASGPLVVKLSKPILRKELVDPRASWGLAA